MAQVPPSQKRRRGAQNAAPIAALRPAAADAMRLAAGIARSLSTSKHSLVAEGDRAVLQRLAGLRR